ncbi:single-stranded DNA-binding protein, partial [Yaniella sp.]|uniref:single-stranded DNA-binding protein n=1 Tax=Yaniella sp. TaxID=2773929 RepID=UPI002647912F
MAGEPTVTIIGNLAGDPELRWTASGHAVANFTIAQTPRSYDKTTQQYVDDETLWVRASVWRDVAENVAETLSKGIRVIAHGRLKARSFETKEGQQRTNWELDVDEIGPSLRWSTAQVNRTPKQGGQQSGNAGQFNQQAPPPAGNQ